MGLSFTPFVRKDFENYPVAEVCGQIARPLENWEVVLTENVFIVSLVSPYEEVDAQYSVECSWITLEGLQLLFSEITWKDELNAVNQLMELGMELVD